MELKRIELIEKTYRELRTELLEFLDDKSLDFNIFIAQHQVYGSIELVSLNNGELEAVDCCCGHLLPNASLYELSTYDLIAICYNLFDEGK